MSVAMSAKHGPLLSLKKTLTPSRSTPRDLPREIVDHTLSCHFFRRERNLEVEIEIASQRRQPFEDDELYARVIDFLNTDYNYLDLVPKGRDKGGRGPSGCAGTPNTRRRPRRVGSCCA